jgi:LPXTG-motif cell wall-anchored protein
MHRITRSLLAVAVGALAAFAPAAPAAAPPTETETYTNCTELRKDYPGGVPKGHPAYDKDLDRDRDGWACEPGGSPTATSTTTHPNPPTKPPATTRPPTSPPPTTTTPTATAPPSSQGPDVEPTETASPPVDNASEELPLTGTPVRLIVSGGLALLLVGGAAVWVLRRRQTRFTA